MTRLETGTLVTVVLSMIGFAFWLGGITGDITELKKASEKLKGEPGKPGEGVPIGTIMAFGGEFNEANLKKLRDQGWLPCQGATELSEDFPELSALIKGTYGNRGQNNQFQLPDVRSGALVGAGRRDGTDGEDQEFIHHSLGDTFGAQTHTLVSGEIPPHSHNIINEKGKKFVLWSEGHTTAHNNITGSSGAIRILQADEFGLKAEPNTGGQPHNNIPPSLAVNFIIKAKKIEPKN